MIKVGNERKIEMGIKRKIFRNKVKAAQKNNKIKTAWRFYQKQKEK